MPDVVNKTQKVPGGFDRVRCSVRFTPPQPGDAAGDKPAEPAPRYTLIRHFDHGSRGCLRGPTTTIGKTKPCPGVETVDAPRADRAAPKWGANFRELSFGVAQPSPSTPLSCPWQGICAGQRRLDRRLVRTKGLAPRYFLLPH